MDALMKKRGLLDELLVSLRAENPLPVPMLVSTVPSGDFGDQGENLAELHRRATQQARQTVLTQQISTLSNGSIPLGPATTVGLGAIVTLRYLDLGGRKTTVFILPVAGGEVLPDGTRVITPNTPLVKALQEHRAGDIVEAETPVGIRRIQILSVE